MAPARKKSKPNQDPHVDPSNTESPDETTPRKPSRPTLESHSNSSPQPKTRPKSWYNGGSWRSKASPVAQIARESISVGRGTTQESSEEAARRPSQSVIKGVKGSRKSVPSVGEATKIHATPEAKDKTRQLPTDKEVDGREPSAREDGADEASLPPSTPNNEDAKSVESARQSGKWFGWWSRPDGYGSDGERAKDQKLKQKAETDQAAGTPLPGSPVDQQSNPIDDQTGVTAPGSNDATGNKDTSAAQWEGMPSGTGNNHTYSRSWFGLWSSLQNQQADQSDSKAQEPQNVPEVRIPLEEPAETTETSSDNAQKEVEERGKSTGWAFWSTDKVKDLPQTPSGTQRQIGELAVADTPSQSHPEAAQFNQQREDKKTTKSDMKRASSLLGQKRGRTDKVKELEAGTLFTPSNSSAGTPPVSQIPTPAETPSREESAAPSNIKQHRPNLVLPSFHDVYSPSRNAGYLERLAQYLAQTLRLPGSASPPPPRHVHISPSRPKIKKAIAIGIHGFFPAPLIQKVIGPPTGTSIRFANSAATSIKEWCHQNQPEIKDVEVETVALEGEGYIGDRVNTLWKLMLNWLSHLRQADFIMVACHSQGVPVAFMLIAKLIQLGCLSPNVRIGICAMAGINLGPFPEYKSRLFGGTALELFDFCDNTSKVSRAYAESLDICLRHGVRATFVGSIDDQLVSLESSLHAPLSHPYVARAVFIDGRLHAPNFLTHLVVFALKLRNLGISDHGLIRELSAPLAGSLVNGDGHSRVYDDPEVYNLALSFALESTDMAVLAPLPPSPHPTNNTTNTSNQTAASSLLATDPARRRASLAGYPSPATANSMRRGSLSTTASLPGIAPVISPYEPIASASNPPNPFYLPWAVRGMLEEEVVKGDEKFGSEVEVLVREFEEWRPVSKVLRDVKWRLEGVRSML